MGVMEEIGKKIAEKRKENGWTQRELAEKLHVSDKNVSKWECGRSVPDVFYLKMLADLFGVDLDFFVASGNAEEMSDINREKRTRAGKISAALLLVFALFPLIVAVISKIFSPETVPCHYDFEGNVTRWGSSKEMILVGISYFVIITIASVAEYVGFVRINNPEIKPWTVWLSFALFAAMAFAFTAITISIVAKNYAFSIKAGYAVGSHSKFSELFSVVINAVYALAGAACLFVPKNALLGVRTTYSFSGKDAWSFVNFVAGAVLYAVAVIMIAVTGILDSPVSIGFTIAATLVPAAAAFAGAYVGQAIHKRISSKNASKADSSRN